MKTSHCFFDFKTGTFGLSGSAHNYVTHKETADMGDPYFFAARRRPALGPDESSTELFVNPVLGRRRIVVEGPATVVTPTLARTINKIVADEAKSVAEAERKATEAREAARVFNLAPKAMTTWDFSGEYVGRLHGHTCTVVGMRHASELGQATAAYKRVGNMALLVPEPDNKADLNALMVLMWNDEAKSWVHVGYVAAHQAALLRSRWVGDYRRPAVARISSKADGSIGLTLTGEVRTYPGYKPSFGAE